jgi:hypothetical protein
MTTFYKPARNFELTINQDWIDVTSSRPSSNEYWKFTDAAGHEHQYANGYPTLRLVVDAEHWCSGDEGWTPHDPHMQVDESHYECPECGEVIEPKMDPPYTPKSMPGLTSATLKGTRSDGTTIMAGPTPDEVEALLVADTDEAQAIIDAIPDERIWSWERTV